MQRRLLALGLIATLAACSHSSSSLVPAQHASQANRTAVPLSIVIPLFRAASAARRPQFISAATQSGGIAIASSSVQAISQAFDLSANAPGCSQTQAARTCSVTVNLPLGAISLTLFTFDGPLHNGAPTGHQLAIASSSQTVVQGQANTVVLSLLGVPASVTITPQVSSIAAGTPASVPLTVAVFDAAGNQITGIDPFAQPIAFGISGAVIGASIGFAANGVPGGALTKPGDAITLTYGGSGGSGATYTIAATTNFGNVTIGTAPLSIVPGFTLVHQVLSSFTNGDLIERFDTRDIWLTEPAAHKIAQLSSTGTFTEFPVPSGKEPRHIVYLGGLLATGPTNFAITEFPDAIGFVGANGTITEHTVPTTNALIGGAFFDSVNFSFWFAEGVGNIGLAGIGGSITEFPTGIAGSTPADVAQDTFSGNILFTDPGTNTIGSMSRSDHSVIEYPIPTSGAGPSVIVNEDTFDTWFAESNAAKLGHFDNSSHAVIEYAAPDVIVSLVAAAADGSGAAVWALTRGGVVLKYNANGSFVSIPVSLIGNGTPFVLTQDYTSNALLLLRNSAGLSDLDRMFY